MAGEFYYQVPANTYPQSVSGGTVATAESMDVVSEFVNAIEPWATPFLNQIMSSKSVDQENFQWGESTRIKLDTNLNGAINNSTTSITVATGMGAIFQKWMVISVYDPMAGSTTTPNEATKEDMWVTAITGDVLTVATRGTMGTSAFSHVDGAIVVISGVAEPQNQEHTEAPRVRGVRKFNYPQRFQAKLTADKRYQNQPTWEHPTNPLEADFAEEILKQRRLLERTAFLGTRLAGDGTPNKPSKMAGLNQQLTTNSIDLGGQLLTPQLIDDALNSLKKEYGTRNLKIVAGIDEARLLDTSINPIRRADVKDDTLNTVVRRYQFRSGTYEVVDMDEFPVPGSLYLLDMSLIQMRPFKGLNWHKSYLKGEENARDSDVWAISGDFTLQVKSEKAMARFYNFETDINQYPQLQNY